MGLTWKTVSKIVKQCLVERTFSVLAGHCLYIGLYRLDIGLEFWTRLWHYLDINAGPITSGMEFMAISVEGFQLLTDIAKDSGALWGSWISFGYYFKVCNIFDQKYILLFLKSFFRSSSRWAFVSCRSQATWFALRISWVAPAWCGFLLRDAFGETIIYYYYLVFSVKCLVYLQ